MAVICSLSLSQNVYIHTYLDMGVSEGYIRKWLFSDMMTIQ